MKILNAKGVHFVLDAAGHYKQPITVDEKKSEWKILDGVSTIPQAQASAAQKQAHADYLAKALQDEAAQEVKIAANKASMASRAAAKRESMARLLKR